MASEGEERVTCACRDCVCTVSLTQAVTREGRVYCCEACADGHKDHAGCGHGGCACHG